MRKYYLILFTMLVLLMGCSAFESPTLPGVPTPVATAVPFSLNTSQFMVTNPVSDVVPQVDPGIVGLMEAVSQQQLKGYVQEMQNFGTRNAFSPTEEENFGIGATRRWIFSELERVGNGHLQVRTDDFILIPRPAKCDPKRAYRVKFRADDLLRTPSIPL